MSTDIGDMCPPREVGTERAHPHRWEPFQPEREHEYEYEGQPKWRHGVRDDGQHTEAPVDGAARLVRGTEARHQTEQQRQELAAPHEQKCGRESLQDQFRHRTLIDHRPPEIPSRQRAEVREVLARERAVEPEIASHRRELLGGEQPRIADEIRHRIPRRQMDQNEVQGDGSHEQRKRRHHPPSREQQDGAQRIDPIGSSLCIWWAGPPSSFPPRREPAATRSSASYATSRDARSTPSTPFPGTSATTHRTR